MSYTYTCDLERMAADLGGEVRNGEIFCPGPQHSAANRSLAVKLDPTAPDAFIVHSFSPRDNPIECRDYVRAKLGLPPFAPKELNADWGPELARYVYKLSDGSPYLLVRKFVDASGKKQFPQSRWEGGSWIKGKPRGAGACRRSAHHSGLCRRGGKGCRRAGAAQLRGDLQFRGCRAMNRGAQ